LEEKMKIVKMKIKREMGGGKTHYVYPKPYYDRDKVRFLIYEKDALARGEDWQYILIGVKDADLAGFLGANGHVVSNFTFTAVEIDRDAAIIDGEEWAPQTEKITDQSKLLKIIAKYMRKEELTEKEKDALDQDKPEKGINKSKSFTESLDEAMAKFQ